MLQENYQRHQLQNHTIVLMISEETVLNSQKTDHQHL